MTKPMTPEQLAEIREAARPGHANILAQLIKHGAHDDPRHGKVIVHGVTVVPAADLNAAVRVVWSGVPALLAEVERRQRGGRELGKVVVHLAELIKAAFVKGETDPAGALLMLGDHLANLFEDEGGLPTDDHNRVYRALEQRRDEVKRLRADLEQCRSMLRQSERTAADFKAQVERWRGQDERLLVGLERDAAERDRRAGQAQRVRELHTPDENGECTNCRESYDPCSTIRALNGSEAGR